MAEYIQRLVFTLVPMILSLTVHECAHAWSAHLLGDDTAKDEGRLTLNPTVHVDPIGTLLIPAINALQFGSGGFIGWARPTPFRSDRMRRGINRRFGSAIVSAAGPLSNVALALVAVGLLALVIHARIHAGEAVIALLFTMFQLNVGLAIFNLLPFPPLDGHRLLPPVFDPIIEPMQRYGFAILMLLFLFTPAGSIVGGWINGVCISILHVFGLSV